MFTLNQGLIDEYYDTVQAALRIDLRREPSHEEIMEIVNKLLDKCKKQELYV